MLKKKEYMEILNQILSKVQVAKLFTDLYHPQPAIRIVKRDYQDRKNDFTLACDNCGERFHTESDTYNSLLPQQACVCPKCKFQIQYRTHLYGNEYQDNCCVDDTYHKYHRIYNGKGTVEPTFVLYEKVNVGDKEYRVFRRFFFKLEKGQIVHVIMHRCLLIPEKDIDDFALLYDNEMGEISVSKSDNPYLWFEKHRYGEPGMQNYHVYGTGEENISAENFDHKFILESCKLLDKSMIYHSKAAVTIRSVFDTYPVYPTPEDSKAGTAYAENHGDYVVLRSFVGIDGRVEERKRWIYSIKDRCNILLLARNDNWSMQEPDGYDSFKDDDFALAEPVFKESFIGKMGLYRYMGEIDDVFHYRTNHANFYLKSLLKKPIIETLLKVGLHSLIPSVVNEKIGVSPNENTLWQKLGLSKTNYKFALDAKLTEDEFVRLQEVNAFDPVVDRDAFIKWQSLYPKMSSYYMKSISEYTGLHVKEMVDYVESVYYNQGIECDEAINLWHDYITLFNSYYERNVKGAEELYPDSLKKAHDVLSMQNNKWLMKHNTVGSGFAEINEAWKHLEFEYGDFKIVLPKNSRDVVLEGNALHHCVGSYVQRIVDRQCLILFIRRKDREEKSFMTMEYDLRGRIIQIKGCSNHTVDNLSKCDPKMYRLLVQFLLKWGRKNNIDVGIEPRKEVA